jgi:hypothetical protein
MNECVIDRHVAKAGEEEEEEAGLTKREEGSTN